MCFREMIPPGSHELGSGRGGGAGGGLRRIVFVSKCEFLRRVGDVPEVFNDSLFSFLLEL